ncbi:MAG: PQQ-binding-like beta-propeller repeat protein [Gemmataceae bacterium]
MTPRVSICLVAVCWIVSCSLAFASDDSAADEQFLHAAGIATNDRSLLDFFRHQTADASTSQRLRQLIEQLGSDSFLVREKASDDLTALGAAALPLLRQSIRTTADLEVRRRARDCAQQIESRWTATLATASARLLALRKPAGTAETLLAFLPGPYDEWVNEEIQNTLVAVARLDRESNAPFLRSLTSPVPAQRTAAALALCRSGAVGPASRRSESWQAVRKLLQDREASVRLSVARELVIVGDRQAVPVLIDLLAQLPAERAEQAEELLYRLAGPQAPQAPLGLDAVARKKCRDAWQVWWRAHGEHVEMAAIKDRERQLGYTLLVLLNDNRVVEWDRDGKPRWQINGLASPLDAEVLPGRRVLIAEHDSKRVTERTLTGAILWEKKLSEPPIHVHRLVDGSTFIATRKQVLEVDRSGQRAIVRYRSAGDSIITARRFRDGRVGCIAKGSYIELSAAGEELRRFAAPPGVCTTNALSLLPNGHLLITAYGGGTVQEYDRAGKVVWEIKMGRPLCAVRLPGGHTLVSSQDMVLVEFDRAGKEVARRGASGHPCQIRRR